MTSATSAAPAASGPEAPARSDRWSRWSDLLNPILVREIQQAVKGRVFPLTILVALAISVVIAAVIASDYRAGGGSGGGAFDAGFATLVPLIVFVVPMHAYNSMRTELKGGIVEQLLLSRLSPGRVLAGKLQAAMVQFGLYVSVLAPLLATSYLLRGVDLPTIAISLVLALVVCVAATAFAVSSAAQAVVPALQGLANLGVALGLGIGTFTLVGFVGSGQYTRVIGALLRASEFPAVMSGILLAAFLSTMLSWLAARSFLLHAFENRSTAFRVFLFALPPLLYGWMLLFVDPAAWREVFPVLSVALLLTGIVFTIFMITEQRLLSPRVRAHAPRTRLLALLCAPLLPGRDRGLLCFVLYVALLAAVALPLWPAGSSTGFGRIPVVLLRIATMAAAYGLVYLGIGRWLRDRLPDTAASNQAARVVLPVVLFLCCIAPLLVDVLARGEVHDWHVGHALNPFWTIEHFLGDRWPAARTAFLIALGVGVVAHARTYARGVREVLEAARERAARGAGAPPVGGEG